MKKQSSQKPELIDGNTAAAWGARLSRVQVVPNFPITPQTEIIETLAKWKADGVWNGEFVPMEGEHSVLSAAIASEATGARTFTASSSQGLLLMHEMHYVASGMRLPIVMANCSRGLSAPITLWSDHSDILAIRDAGWMMFFAKDNQEVVDLIIQSYKIAEDRDVLLPAVVNMEGFTLSYTREPAEIPEQEIVDKFLPQFKPKVFLDINKPMILGCPVLNEFMNFKAQQRKAMMNAEEKISEVFKSFEKSVGRKYSKLEEYMTEDAETVFVSLGSNSTIIQAAVDSLRKRNQKVGLLRILCYRPFPEEEIKKALKNAEKIIVVDNDISTGYGGIIYPEIKAAVSDSAKKFSNVIVSLGGRFIGRKDFEEIAKKVASGKEEKYWYM
ncbi:pyruvate ferredoxin oxidoreductase [archaeon]|nr:MAG: pyruvate ferredoxin oxidoreductase [archaeon]